MDHPAQPKWQSVPTTVLPALFTRESLTKEQEAKFQSFKKGRAKEYINKQHDLDLLRWLVAREWDVDKATDMFVNSMKWRAANNVDTILEDFPKSPWFKFITENFPSTHTDPNAKELFTKDGQPLVLEKVGLIDPESTALYPLDDLIRFHIYAMELSAFRRDKIFEANGFKALPSCTVVEDLSGLGLSHLNTTLLGVLREWTKIDSDNYPETLRKVVVVNLPSIFNIIWKMVQYIWDDNQKAKFQFIPAGTDPKDILKEFIFDTDLPVAYGGEWTYNFPEKKTYKQFKALAKAIKPRYEKHHVPRSGTFELPFALVEGQSLTWDFETKGYDIMFEVLFRSQTENKTIMENTRFDSHLKPVSGTLQVTKPGTYILRWDNSFSWTRGKDLRYVTKIGPDAPAPPAPVASEVEKEKKKNSLEAPKKKSRLSDKRGSKSGESKSKSERSGDKSSDKSQ